MQVLKLITAFEGETTARRWRGLARHRRQCAGGGCQLAATEAQRSSASHPCAPACSSLLTGTACEPPGRCCAPPGPAQALQQTACCPERRAGSRALEGWSREMPLQRSAKRLRHVSELHSHTGDGSLGPWTMSRDEEQAPEVMLVLGLFGQGCSFA